MEEELHSKMVNNNILVIWRGKKLNVEMNYGATLKELGYKLQDLTNIKSDTMRLLVPRSSDKPSQMLMPFSDQHSTLTLQETPILEVKSIRMMGVFEDEVEEVLKSGTKADLRIAGFDEEEKRLRQRTLTRPQTSLRLPQGNYIFCDFRTLQIPGIELNPPPSEALKRMHMLAADPGIVAIMNKHRWRVGVMTEMAPVGYVGVSPKCILGYNKNHGEEISLRLRTDDLKGFRKYERIKSTLLHELAHMVYSEHDSNFYALDKQLNQEAASLDWTRSRSHTLSGHGRSDDYEEVYVEPSSSSSHKLGGKTSDQLASARASSIAAAYSRLANAPAKNLEGCEAHAEPDPDDSMPKENMEVDKPTEVGWGPNYASVPDENLKDQNIFEPDPDDSGDDASMKVESYSKIAGNGISSEPDPEDCEMANYAPNVVMDEPDPDDSIVMETQGNAIQLKKASQELDIPDESEIIKATSQCRNSIEPDPEDSHAIESVEEAIEMRVIQEEPEADHSKVKKTRDNVEPDPDDSLANRIVQSDGIDDNHQGSVVTPSLSADEPDPDDEELRRIQDPVAVVCTRLQKAIEMLRSEVNPLEAASVLQTLFKIIRNVIEHPNEIKFRRLRKANPQFQRNVANYKAAMEVLFLIGFNEDTVPDEIGRVETYVVLKRNDPGLLWLAKSSLEMCIAH